MRWAVDLSPAEFAFVEAARDAGHWSRADFLMYLAERFAGRLFEPSPALTQSATVLQAERELRGDEDDDADRDQYSRGGRRPHPVSYRHRR